MKTLLIVPVLAVVASLGLTGAAFAIKQLPPPFEVLPKAGPAGGSARTAAPTSPGDAFDATPEVEDVRGDCAVAGGLAKKRFDGTEFVWVCIQ
jgi:hypothetical protein